ncbi:adenosine deaminase, partial [Enterococcus hirae]
NKKHFNMNINNKVPLHQTQISIETTHNDIANYKTQITQTQNLLNLLIDQSIPQNLLPTQPIKHITQQNIFTTNLPNDLLNNL